MSEAFHTVEQAAGRLGLHRKTVLRLIREGRLRATRIGKSYRILRSDLEAFAGVVRPANPGGARVTAIVDVPDIEPERARRLALQVTGARLGQTAHPDPMHIEVAHDPVRRSVKVVIAGAPGDAAAMLGMLDAWLAD